MKLDRVALHGFLSHADTDWNPNGARLVSLVGANGAGKSSLLDGVAYALFDSARGKTDDLVQLGATDMSVVVEFEYSGARYRVARGRTTRAGGKSFLELHVVAPDGTWRPLTAPSIRETQVAIEELLRVDAATFSTAVMLMQGRANAFAEATAAERKRILSTVLGLDVYARAEAVARDRTLELAQQQRDQQRRAGQLDETLAGLPEVREAMAIRAADVAAIAEDMTLTNADRAAGEKRLQELAALIAAGDAAEAEAARIGEELLSLRDRYRRAQERRASAERMRNMAATTLAAESSVRAAAARIPDLEAAVSAAEAREALAIALDERIRREREAHQAATAAADREYSTWQANHAGARRHVDELAASVQQLAPVICEACGHPSVVDQADLRGKLKTARSAFAELEASQPKTSTSSARDAAAIVRLEERRRELGDVRSPLAEARGELSRIQSQAARLEAIEQARATHAQAEADIAAADEELADATGKGNAASERLKALRAQVQQLQGFRAERIEVTATVGAAATRLTDLGRQHAEAIADVGRLRASIEQLDQLAAERAELVQAIETTSTAAARERKLVQAFGVTGIPARVIESVLPELGSLAQEVLSQLRPGLELSLRGTRAKRDGKGVIEALDLVVRDGAGERPLQLFSGGERTSVSLAIAVGLSRLVARRAGARIESLFVDEPDGLDLEARRSFGQSLRLLAHNGALARIVLVSHHEDLAEMADEVFRVEKRNGSSVVELAA